MESQSSYQDIHDVPSKMKQPNEPITVHVGTFELRQGANTISVEGKILFGWIPEIGMKFSGKVSAGNALRLFDRMAKVQVVANSLVVGEAFVNHITHSHESELEGNLFGIAVWGDKSIAVSKVYFGIPNMRYFFGAPVTHTNGGKTQLSRSRLTFENDHFVINIDKVDDFEDRMRSLTIAGGYSILYGGSIEHKRNSVKLSDLDEVLASFSHFLTFLNGRRCCPTILTGTHNNEVIWQDYSGYISNPYKFVYSWPCQMNTEGISLLWSSWSDLAKEELDFDFLKTAVHWYGEANSNAASVEGSVILAQTALELIYNWFVVENKGIIVGADATNISASNKIRLLLNQLNVNFEVPPS